MPKIPIPQSFSQWREEQIEQRAEKLAELALKVWPYFSDQSQPVSRQKSHEITGTKPSHLTIRNQKFIVRTWRNVLVQTLIFLANSEDYDSLEKLMVEYPKFISNNATTLRYPIELTGGYFFEANLSTDRIYHFCQQAKGYFGYFQEDWQVDYQ